MNLLFIGDIVSRIGRRIVKKELPRLRNKKDVDFVIANAENIAGGRGVTSSTLYEILEAGVDYFTSGNHVFFRENWSDLLTDNSYRLLRPANYPEDIPGRGHILIPTEDDLLLLVNLAGQTSFNSLITKQVTCPFRTIDRVLAEHEGQKPTAVIVDFHAESTSEKVALGHYLDGRVSAVIGTHTHVPSADARLLPGGTAYVTDVGMTGALNSVLGVKKSIIWDFLKYPYPQRFEWKKKGAGTLQSVLIRTNTTSKSKHIERIDIYPEANQ